MSDASVNAVRAVLQQFIDNRCTHIRTTAYHSVMNGIIKRFHCQLKSSLQSYSDPTNLTDILPVVLLEICTLLKDDLHCTSAELVYGITLRLLGNFLIQKY